MMIMNNLKKIENEKEVLVNKCLDFNTMDTFRDFDQEGKGSVNLIEFVQGLFELDITPDMTALQAFFKLFGSDQGKRIRYSDFSKAFLPINSAMQSDLLNRQP